MGNKKKKTVHETFLIIPSLCSTIEQNLHAGVNHNSIFIWGELT